jgi:SOS-response transcriptional repressor LexA
MPANARMKPIEAPARDVEIRGIVRALVRRY